MKIIPKRLTGTVEIQPSKSYLHRMIIMAGLCGRRVKVCNVNYSDDIEATLSAVEAMGIGKVIREDGFLTVDKGDGVLAKEIDCKESGSTLRFMIGVALCTTGRGRFVGHGRLMERPQSVYRELCENARVDFCADKNAIEINGKLAVGEYRLKGNVSSQFVSGLLMGLSALNGQSTVTVCGELGSAGYVDITVEVMRAFGTKVHKEGDTYTVTGGYNPPEAVFCPGDWSHAVNYLTMGAKYGGITFEGVELPSLQRDSSVVDILKSVGAGIKYKNGVVALEKSNISPARIDGSNIPDAVPALCVLLGVCDGESRVTGVGRLRFKESDRVVATCDLINDLGGNAQVCGDTIVIQGVAEYKGGAVKTYGDHRIAMAAAVASCYCNGEIQLDDGECVKKSAPDFWREFAELGGKVELYV